MIFFSSHAQGFPQERFYLPEGRSERGPLKEEMRFPRLEHGCEGWLAEVQGPCSGWGLICLHKLIL